MKTIFGELLIVVLVIFMLKSVNVPLSISLIPKVTPTPWTTVFYDNFDNYTLSAVKGNQASLGSCTNDPALGGTYLGGGRSAASAVQDPCSPPPHYNPAYADGSPEYWKEAASSGSCAQPPNIENGGYQGGCVSADGYDLYPPNTLVGIVSEQYYSCCQSLKIGRGDYGEKVALSFKLAASEFGPFPALINETFHIWLSNGIDNTGLPNNNHFSWWIAGEQMLYAGSVDKWQYQCGGSPGSGAGTKFCTFGSYKLSTQTWHTISTVLEFVNPNASYFYDLRIDGVSINTLPLSNVFSNILAGGACSTYISTPMSLCLANGGGVSAVQPPQHYWQAYTFSWFPGGLNYNQSIYYLGSTNAFYVYLDDPTVSDFSFGAPVAEFPSAQPLLFAAMTAALISFYVFSPRRDDVRPKKR